MQLIGYLLINGSAVFIASYILPGVQVDSFLTAVVVAVVLGVVNISLKPLLILLTLPLTIITLGLFTFVINALLVLLTDALIPGFSVDNFLWALVFSFVISLVSSFLSNLTKKRD
jgi:putative membrane protein